MTNDNYCGDSDEENRRRRILCNDRRLASSTGEKKLNMKYNYGCINMIPPIYGVGSIFMTVIVIDIHNWILFQVKLEKFNIHLT